MFRTDLGQSSTTQLSMLCWFCTSSIQQARRLENAEIKFAVASEGDTAITLGEDGYRDR